MVSNLNESCDNACSRNMKGPCSVEGMRAMSDITQLKYVASKLLEPELLEPNNQYLCDGGGGSQEGYAPGISEHGMYCYQDGSVSSCAGLHEYMYRFCCCGDGNSMCPLED